MVNGTGQGDRSHGLSRRQLIAGIAATPAQSPSPAPGAPVAFADPFTANLAVDGEVAADTDSGPDNQDLPRTGPGIPLGWTSGLGAASIAAGIAMTRRRRQVEPDDPGTDDSD